MSKSDILKKMAAVCLAIYGTKEKIPSNVERYMFNNPLKGIGLIMQRHEMPANNQTVAEILAALTPDELDFDRPANTKEQGAWYLALYQ